MALKPCKSCKHQVDTTAKTCPNCGVAKPGVKASEQVVGLIVVFLVIVFGAKMCSHGDKGQSTAEAPKIDEATCRKELNCWAEKTLVSASVNCVKPIERLAKYNARWTDGTFDLKFSHYRWKDQAKGTVTYIGDKIEFQNGFGAYQKHIYECDFSPSSETVLDVRARPGQL